MRKDLLYNGLSIVFLAIAIPPPVSAAQVVQLAPNGESDCRDLTQDLRFGMGGDKDASHKADVLRMQLVLVKEGFPIREAQFGTFGVDTFLAVVGFQEKYKKDILAPAKLLKGNGFAGPLTRRKLNALHGCQVATSTPVAVAPIILSIKGILLDKDGISVTFCNLSPASIPTFPVRIRLNGIVREFDVRSAAPANTCYPARWPYETWGLSYDSEVIYTTVVTIDPFGYYKKGAVFYPDLETIATPAVEGMSLSVRSLLFRGPTLQATFCNMGTKDLSSFPVSVFLNGKEREFDVANARESGKCASTRWPLSQWGGQQATGTIYAAVILINEEKIINGGYHGIFTNAAAVRGTP